MILAITIPAHTTINAEQYPTCARVLLDEFDRTETGDLLVPTSKGQQEAIHEFDISSGDVQGPLVRFEHALHATVAFVIMPILRSRTPACALNQLDALSAVQSRLA